MVGPRLHFAGKPRPRLLLLLEWWLRIFADGVFERAGHRRLFPWICAICVNRRDRKLLLAARQRLRDHLSEPDKGFAALPRLLQDGVRRPPRASLAEQDHCRSPKLEDGFLLATPEWAFLVVRLCDASDR